MNKENLKIINSFNNIANNEILVVGDVMLDTYISGSINRISPEGPLPVFLYDRDHQYPGGAANVAINLQSIGMKVSLFSSIGDDTVGSKLLEKLKNKNIKCYFKKNKKVKTINKIRIIDKKQQLIRIDYEDDFKKYKYDNLYDKIKKIIYKFKVVILSDYKKGVLDYIFIRKIIKLCKLKKIKIIVDPKIDDFSIYENAFAITPNKKEFERVMGKVQNKNDLVLKGKQFLKKYQFSYLIVTLGSEGSFIISKLGNFEFFDALKIQNPEVVGAGDTFISFFSSMVSANADIQIAAKVANIAASISVKQNGTKPVKLADLKNYLCGDCGKIIDFKNLKLELKNYIESKIVFTNGCFDILHPGHIELFKDAKKYGDLLIVALNSDKSIKKIKGPNRPINNQYFRSSILESIKYIDFIIMFDETTPLNLIRGLKPDTIVKGGDYKKKDVVGYQDVKKYGGKVVISKFIENFSSSLLIKKIKKNT